MGGGVERPRGREPALAVAQEGDDRLVLQGEKRDEIDLAVAVNVDGHDVNGSRARIELRALEGGLAPIERPVAQEVDLALRMQAERGHRDIRLPGAGAA